MADEADEQLVQMARMSHTMLRSLIDSASPSTPDPGPWHHKLMEAAKEYLTQTAKMMKQVFNDRTMPRDVAAFVEECDRYLG